jgi:hypothetical protein
MRWRTLLRPGDWLVMALGAALVAASLPLLWQGGFAERAIVRQDGQVFAEVDLRNRRQLEVPGPLGTTLISIEPGRARVVADWLARPGEIAICAPNRVSVQITGRTRTYDSLSY